MVIVIDPFIAGISGDMILCSLVDLGADKNKIIDGVKKCEKFLPHSTLKNIEKKLPDTIFLKVHRSYIINVSKIIDIEDNSVLIKKDVIPVSRSNRSELMKRLNLL